MKHNHIPIEKSILQKYLNSDPDLKFGELSKDWVVRKVNNQLIRDRVPKITVDEDDNEVDETPIYFKPAIHFELKHITHINFNFYIYDDYENPEMAYIKPAVYYYGNWVSKAVECKVRNLPCSSFFVWCQELEKNGDKFALHNYAIDMETINKYNFATIILAVN